MYLSSEYHVRCSVGKRGGGAPIIAPAAPNRQPSTQILFTGKLLGYLRMPEHQSAVAPPEDQVCPADSPKNSNARNFLDTVDQQRAAKPNTVLVGMGDNFSPELERSSRISAGATNLQLPLRFLCSVTLKLLLDSQPECCLQHTDQKML